MPNGAVLRIDPTRPDREPDLLSLPDADYLGRGRPLIRLPDPC